MNCQRGLFKKKKIKTMNNKMAINTNPSMTESKKETKQTRTQRIMDTENILIVARWEQVGAELVKK